MVGSLASGMLAAALGYRDTIWIAVMVFVIALAMVIFSPVTSPRRPALSNENHTAEHPVCFVRFPAASLSARWGGAAGGRG